MEPDVPVIFTGLITLPEKVQVLVDSDVVVYPGVHEIFGLVPFEALLCGRPVVVAGDSGCGELISGAKAGFTFRPNDVDGLLAAIESALSGSGEIENMVERGRSFVRNELAWTSIAQEVERVYIETNA